jgi:hypothetical protein
MMYLAAVMNGMKSWLNKLIYEAVKTTYNITGWIDARYHQD